MARLKKKPAEAAAHLKPHQFKPGQTGNPNGRPTLTKEQRAMRALTLTTYREVIEMALTGNMEELKAFAQDPDTPVIQVGVAVAILRAIKNGDASVLEMFAARIIGRIPEVINVNNTNTPTTLATLSETQLEERLRRIRSKLD